MQSYIMQQGIKLLLYFIILYCFALCHRLLVHDTIEEEKKDINKLQKKVKKMIDPQFHDITDNPTNIHQNQSLSLAKQIRSDASHPLHHLFNMLPSRRWLFKLIHLDFDEIVKDTHQTLLLCIKMFALSIPQKVTFTNYMFSSQICLDQWKNELWFWDFCLRCGKWI